jgi:hypothetical protein
MSRTQDKGNLNFYSPRLHTVDLVQCSTDRPSCAQCIRAGRVCPGYRDAFDVIFRNETESTERKALRARRQEKKVRSPVEARRESVVENDNDTYSRRTSVASQASTLSERDHFSSVASSRNPSPALVWDYHSPKSVSILSSPAPSPGFSPSVQDQALCHFMSNFVLLPRKDHVRGYMDFLLPLMAAKDYAQSTLSLAVSAVSMASLCTRPASKSLLPNAARLYTKALTGINADLRDPKMALEDQSLASVMILGLFEVCYVAPHTRNIQ